MRISSITKKKSAFLIVKGIGTEHLHSPRPIEKVIHRNERQKLLLLESISDKKKSFIAPTETFAHVNADRIPFFSQVDSGIIQKVFGFIIVSYFALESLGIFILLFIYKNSPTEVLGDKAHNKTLIIYLFSYILK